MIKAAVALASNKKVRKFLGGVLAAVLSPVIVVMVLLCSLGTGAAQHNVSAVRLCFDSGTIPEDVPAEYRAHIEEMRGCFALLDGAVDEVNRHTEDGQSLDAVRIKAIFYALFFGEEAPGRRDCRRFVDCFVDYETRTQTVTWTDDGGNEHEREEVYAVAVPVENLAEVYQKISAALSLEVSADQQANAESVYQLAQHE